MTTQYETLRTAALGDGLPLEARRGLAFFLRRGMWGWVQAAAIPTRALVPTRSRFASSSTSTADEDRTVIHLFAAMAMRSTNQRA